MKYGTNGKKLFGTDGIRGIANNFPITSEIALKLGKALAYQIKDAKSPKIVIGKDTRLSGYMLETALASGIVSMGVDVYLVGPLPTPGIALLTKSLNANNGIMITASHNPYQDNGIKIFDSSGFKLPDDKEKKIEDIMFSKNDCNEITGNMIGKAYRLDEARGRYIEFAKSTIKDFSLEGIKIVLDCANGSSYYVAPKIFAELGAEVIILNDKPDGMNINKNCGAVHPKNTGQRVIKEKADIGITLDGDSDRLIICDEKGEIIDGDHILAYSAIEMKKQGLLNKNTLVVTDYSNIGLDISLKKHDIKTVRTKNGDRYVLEAMKYNKYNLGGEASGHMIFLDYTTTGDGIVSALQMLKLLKKNNIKVSEIRKVIKKFPQILLNIDVKEKKPFDHMPKVKDKINQIKKQLKDNGRLLLRYSGTQMVCRVMIEGKNKLKITHLANDLADLIKKEIGK